MKRIAIHSVPRSGSTWLGNIFNSHPNVAFRYQPLFSYAFKDKLNEKSTKEEIINFFENIKSSSDEFIHQTDGIEKGIIPSFDKRDTDHICYKEVRYHNLLQNMLEKDKELIVIGLVRNPMAVIYSWLNAPKEFKKELGWKEKEEWRYAPKKNREKLEEFNGFEKWKEVTLLFLALQKKYPDRFYLLQYDDLLKQTKNEVEKVFNFCGLTMSKKTVNFINDSTSNENDDAYSVFKNKKTDDGWKNKLSQNIIQEIQEDLSNSNLIRFIK